jgi:hypothetical protein
MTERTEPTATSTLDSTDPRYVAPAITPLGHLADLTLLGSGGLDELESDGSQA